MHGGTRSRILPAAQEAYIIANLLCSISIYFVFSGRNPCAPWSTASRFPGFCNSPFPILEQFLVVIKHFIQFAADTDYLRICQRVIAYQLIKLLAQLLDLQPQGRYISCHAIASHL